jgi:hypothetical protein
VIALHPVLESALLRPDAGSAGRRAGVHCPPGQEFPHPRPGDLILVRGETWIGRCIRAFERVRCARPHERAYARWSHVALVVSVSGLLVEAMPGGMRLRPIGFYRSKDYHYVALDLSDAQRGAAVHHVYSCMRQPYDVAAFFMLALSILLGGRLRVPDRDRPGCVATIARALRSAGLDLPRRPTDMTPSDLAKWFGVRP